MKKYAILLLGILSLSSECEPEIEFVDNQRIAFEGRIMDSLGNPVENVPVEIYASRDFFDPIYSSVRSNDELLGKGRTDATGSFSLLTLSPSNALNIYGLINYNQRGIAGADTPIVLNAIDFLELKNFTFDLQTLVIEELRNFDFRVERSNNMTDTLEYSLRYKPEIKSIDFNENRFLDPFLTIDEFYDNVLPPSEDFQEFRIKVRETDTIFMNYQTINNGVIEIDSLQIVVNENGNEFIFKF